jgi:hypothetical protein
MAIEKRGHSVVATACPYCEEPLAEQVSLANHLNGSCPEFGGDDGDE